MAALALSIAAFVVSVVSAVFAGVAVVAAGGVKRIEQARRLEERRPRFTAQARPGASPPGCDLALTLVSDEALADVLTEIVYLRGGISFKYGAKGVKSLSFAYAYDPTSGEPAGLRPGESVSWPLEVRDAHLSPLRLKVTCRGGDTVTWTVPLSVDVPG